MTINALKQRLAAVSARQRRMQLAFALAGCWGSLALLGAGLIYVRHHGNLTSPVWALLLVVLGIAVAGVLFIRHRRRLLDLQDIARRIELRHPELNGVLLTAVQQQSGTGPLNYLQQRIVREALQHGNLTWWTSVSPWQRAGAHLTHLLALAIFLWVLSGMTPAGKGKGLFAGGWSADGVTVSPGDTSIERGERLVVIASFKGSLPVNAALVTGTAESAKRFPLVKSLSDPVYGGSVPEVLTNLVYHVEYDGRRTPDFNVTVFEFPRLERADADLAYPAYTGLEPKHIDNTRRITAVEGTRLDLNLQLNKPVVRAQFIAKGDATNAIPLTVGTNSPTATLLGLTLATNRTYLLQLVDAEGRTNKLPAQFVVEALPNREPEMKLTSPRGDQRPSALEELSFEGTVWDDFGIQAYGLAYIVAGEEPKFIELGKAVAANEKRPFKHLLRLEDLKLQPDQLIAWYLWADDIGPDGQPRRTAGDMYFGEIRPFEEVFREGQGGGGGGGGGQQGGGNASSQLADLQKQIINATWKLQRQHGLKQSIPRQEPKPAKDGEKSTFNDKLGEDRRGYLALNRISRVEPLNRRSRREEALTFLEERMKLESPHVVSYLAANEGGLFLSTQSFQPNPSSRTSLFFGQRAADTPAPTNPTSRVRESLERLSSTNQPASASQYVTDLGVVRDAVSQAIEQAKSQRERVSDPTATALWDDVISEMEKAKEQLDKAVASPPSLADAVSAERSAYQALLKLQQREYSVTRNRNQSQGGARQQQLQRQLDQLDLTQSENRYENESQAQAPQSPERREQLQVQNRLSELARRQQDVNERLKELQTALQEAQTEEQRQEIQRQLKRLQEEEQRMLADVDELQQRLNRPENQSRSSEQRQQLEQARQDVQRAADATQDGAVSQALAAGTRAERQLQQMRDDARRQNSSALAEDLRRLRNEARETDRQQQAIQQQMNSLAGTDRKTLDDSPERKASLEQLAQQQQRLTNLVVRATELSQQAEQAEPLASRELYDTLRKFSQEDADSVRDFQDAMIQNGLLRTELYRRLAELSKSDEVKSVELTSEMLRQGLLPQAQQAGDRTRTAVADLRTGIERATEKVLGDDTDALRQARQQLDQLSEQVEHEIAQSERNGTNDLAASAARAGERSADTNSPAQAGSRSGQAPELAQAGRGQSQASNTQSPTSEREGEGNQDGQSGEQSESQQSGQQGQQSAQAAGGGQGGQNRGDAQDQTVATAPEGRANRGPRNGGLRGGSNVGGGRLPEGLERFLGGGGRGATGNEPVITGDGYQPWSDQLREVEEMVDDTALQSQLATARERARALRQEYRRTSEAPDWGEVRTQVLSPLVEVRNQIVEELARRGPKDNLVPIDRDPVPSRYAEQVRKYYEELGKDK